MSKSADNPADQLKSFKQENAFFIGIDSDGCVFDSMEIKHKECFCPVYIKHFGLQPISKYAREVWDFINLYSNNRGCNRFHAVLHAMDHLSRRKEVRDRDFTVPALAVLRDWVTRESKLGNPALTAEWEKTQNPELKIVLDWSLEVNKTVKDLVKNVPPFPYVRQSLEIIRQKTDAIVVSQTPGETLAREWEEHNLSQYVKLIAGQEMGSKSEHLQHTAGGKYPARHALMIGDALGDLEAAQENNMLFFPVNPGNEEASWKRFYAEALDKFLNGTYHGAYETELIRVFRGYLPEKTPWQEL